MSQTNLSDVLLAATLLLAVGGTAGPTILAGLLLLFLIEQLYRPGR